MGQTDAKRIRISIPVAHYLDLFHPGSHSNLSSVFFFLSLNEIKSDWRSSAVGKSRLENKKYKRFVNELFDEFTGCLNKPP